MKYDTSLSNQCIWRSISPGDTGDPGEPRPETRSSALRIPHQPASTTPDRRAEMNTAFAILFMIRIVGARRLQHGVTCAFVPQQGRVAGVAGSSRCFVTTSEETGSGSAAQQQDGDDDGSRYIPPWSMQPKRGKSAAANARFRQHINPLSR